MKLALRNLQKGETDFEFIFGILFIPILLTVSLVIVGASSHLSIFCVFHRLTGIPCPACGSFRCAEQFVAGRVREAWLTQPLITILLCLALVYAAYSWMVVLLKLPRLRVAGISRGQRWLLVFLALAAVLVNWAYIALRGI